MLNCNFLYEQLGQKQRKDWTVNVHPLSEGTGLILTVSRKYLYEALEFFLYLGTLLCHVNVQLLLHSSYGMVRTL